MQVMMTSQGWHRARWRSFWGAKRVRLRVLRWNCCFRLPVICLDGCRVIFVGLNRKASGKAFAVHKSVFNRSSSEVRQRIMSAIPELATVIITRGRIDYPESAVSDIALAAARAVNFDKMLIAASNKRTGEQRILEIKRDLLLIPDP